MALHLIVDGYNLIRQCPELQELEARGLEAGRTALLELLAYYRQARPGYRLTVVFDGWEGGEPKESRHRHRGLWIIYSRRGERADEVIKRLLDQERQRALLVSSDGELRDWADRVGAAWIAAAQFAGQYLYRRPGGAPEEDPVSPRPRGPHKKGPSRRLPKRLRQRQQRLKKL